MSVREVVKALQVPLGAAALVTIMVAFPVSIPRSLAWISFVALAAAISVAVAIGATVVREINVVKREFIDTGYINIASKRVRKWVEAVMRSRRALVIGSAVLVAVSSAVALIAIAAPDQLSAWPVASTFVATAALALHAREVRKIVRSAIREETEDTPNTDFCGSHASSRG